MANKLLNIVFLLTRLIASISRVENASKSSGLPKCCDIDSSVVEENSTLSCEKGVNFRNVVNVSIVNSKSDRVLCVETFKSDFYIFESETEGLTLRDGISSYFHKCCPLGRLYNNRNKSCDNSNLESAFQASFYKVGLPDCKIIKDTYFPSFTSLMERGKDVNPNQCLDKTVDGSYVLRNCESLDICKTTMCIRKCCADGKSFVNGSHCQDTFEKGFYLGHFSENIENSTDDFAIVHGYQTAVYLPQTRKFFIDSHGNFHNNSTNLSYTVAEEVYCIEHATKDDVDFGFEFFRIFPQAEQEKPLALKFHFSRYAMIISEFFLVATVVLYVVNREIKKVFGKLLINFCASLGTMYGILVFFTYDRSLHYKQTEGFCKIMGFSILYLTFTCFVWLQIMSIDIYSTFGSATRIMTASEKKERDFKKFLYYSIYGWGLPLVLTSFSIAFHHVDILPETLRIEIGKTKCYIEKGEGKYAEIVFRTLPLTIIELINCGIFFKTVRYYLSVKNEVARLNEKPLNLKKKKRFFAKKERFSLVTKLLITMGVNYLFEVVSSFYDFKLNRITMMIEIIWDVINCLQGFFIFIIFACKKKNFQVCRQSATVEKMRKISVTSFTRSTSMSSTFRIRKISFDWWRNSKDIQNDNVEAARNSVEPNRDV